MCHFCARILRSIKDFYGVLKTIKTALQSHFRLYNAVFAIGRSDGIRTHGLLVPNQARYQLRYTPC